MTIRRTAPCITGLAVAAALFIVRAEPVHAQGHKALDRMVADLLPRVESLSGLEARAPFMIRGRTRDELRAYLEASAAEDAAKRDYEHAQQAYRLLGLLPDSLDLLDIAPELLARDIAGYYDFRTDTLFILDDVPEEELRAVVAHEMTHALQDQHFRLDSLVSRELDNDRLMAVRAAIEGHATLVMLMVGMEDVRGEPMPFDELPDLTRLPLEALMPGRPSPEFSSAPRLLRESGAFPYGKGLGLAHALRTRDSTAVPFLDGLPASTEQVVDPYNRLLDEPDPPTGIALDGDVGDGWQVVYTNTLGQFELSILLMERDRLQSEDIARGWDGDRYRLLSDGERTALEWFIVWDDARSASRFVSTYTRIIGRRMGTTGTVETVEIDGRPGVRIVETERGVDPASVPRAAPRIIS